MKLPPELRDKIYRYHLILPGQIKPTPASDTSFVNKHYKNCLLGKHVWFPGYGQWTGDKSDTLRCVDPFTGITQFLPVPESVLSLLLVSRQITTEGTHIFYRFNNFVFHSVRTLQSFLDAIGKRYHYLGELSFVFSSALAREVFVKLQNCPFLTKLHIVMRHDAPEVWLNKGGTLASATGMRELRWIRGIKVLDLVGQDCGRVAGTPGQPDRERIDIMDDAAIGPRLRRDLMTPRPYDLVIDGLFISE